MFNHAYMNDVYGDVPLQWVTALNKRDKPLPELLNCNWDIWLNRLITNRYSVSPDVSFTINSLATPEYALLIRPTTDSYIDSTGKSALINQSFMSLALIRPDSPSTDFYLGELYSGTVILAYHKRQFTDQRKQPKPYSLEISPRGWSSFVVDTKSLTVSDPALYTDRPANTTRLFSEMFTHKTLIEKRDGVFQPMWLSYNVNRVIRDALSKSYAYLARN